MIIQNLKSKMILISLIILIGIICNGCGRSDRLITDTNETFSQREINSSGNNQQTTKLESKTVSAEQESKGSTVWHPGDPSQVSNAYEPDSTISVGSNVTRIDNNISQQSEPVSEPQEESKKEGKEVHIGDKITTDYGEMSIESYKISKKFDYTIKDYDGNTIPLSLDAKEGKTYLIFTGIYKNTSGDKLCPDIIDEGAIVNDQYEYSYSFWEDDILAGLGITYQGGLDPLESNRYYGLLEVPDEAMNKLTKCELTFRFCGGKSYGYSGETYRLIITR